LSRWAKCEQRSTDFDRSLKIKTRDSCDPARDLYGRDLVLLRPDQHVAWRGNSAPDDPLEFIDRTRGASR